MACRKFVIRGTKKECNEGEPEGAILSASHVATHSCGATWKSMLIRLGYDIQFETLAGGLLMQDTTSGASDVLIAIGRDATDCAVTTSFGRAKLTNFQVTSDEVQE